MKFGDNCEEEQTSIIDCLVQKNRHVFLGLFKTHKDFPSTYSMISQINSNGDNKD